MTVTKLNDIYQNILQKFMAAMGEIKILDDEAKIIYIEQELNLITKLLKKSGNGEISLEVIGLLEGITFSDFLLDKVIIEAVCSNNSKILLNNSGLFVKKTDEYYHDNFSLFKMDDHADSYTATKFYVKEHSEEIVTLSDLDKFTTLDKSLNDSDFIGFSAYLWTYKVTVLYSGKIADSPKYFTLYQLNDKLETVVTDKDYPICGFFHSIQKNERQNPIITIGDIRRTINDENGLEDRAFIIAAIKKQLENDFGTIGVARTRKPV